MVHSHSSEPLSDHLVSQRLWVLREWLSSEVIDLIEGYVRILIAQDRLASDLGEFGSGMYGDALADSLVVSRASDVAAIVGRRVYPSYGYVRAYWQGAQLPVHRDRVGCDWTMSVAIARQPRTLPWALQVGDHNELHEVTLEPGDAVLFAGRDVLHGRNGFSPGWYIALFLHWVTDPHDYLDGRSMTEHARRQAQELLGGQ